MTDNDNVAVRQAVRQSVRQSLCLPRFRCSVLIAFVFYLAV